MNSWGYIAVGLLCSLIGGWLYIEVVSQGLSALGTLAFLGFTAAGVVLTPIGLIGHGVRIGSRESRRDRDAEESVAA